MADGHGSCLPKEDASTSVDPSIPPLTCALGYHSDGNGNCVAPVPEPSPSCPTGYKYDGNGNCVTIDNPTICVTGFESDEAGGCLPVTIVDTLPPPCPSGYVTNGEGECEPNVATEVACASGFTPDGEGGCTWVPITVSG